MKSLIEAAIAILIVYLFFEWQKEKTATASSASATATAAPASAAAPSPCGCGGASTGGVSHYASPDAALPVSAPVGEHVLVGVFHTEPAVASGSIPAVAPAPVAAGPVMRPRFTYSVSAA